MSADFTPTQRRWFLISFYTGLALVVGGWLAEEGLQQVGLRTPNEALGVTTRSGGVFVRTDWAIALHALGAVGAGLILVPMWLGRSKIKRDAQVQSEQAIAKSLNKSPTDVGAMMDFSLLVIGLIGAVQVYRLTVDLTNLLSR